MMVAASGSLASCLFLPVTRRRAVRVCVIVGTLLTLFNHGDSIWLGQWPVWWKLVLTYLTPYLVSSYSTAAFICEVQRAPSGAWLLEEGQ